MSVFGKIMSAIFGHRLGKSAGSTGCGRRVGSQPGYTGSSTAPLASQNKEKLDWRRSIVDLMKLLKLDSSLSARQEPVRELHYLGDTKDSIAISGEGYPAGEGRSHSTASRR